MGISPTTTKQRNLRRRPALQPCSTTPALTRSHASRSPPCTPLYRPPTPVFACPSQHMQVTTTDGSCINACHKTARPERRSGAQSTLQKITALIELKSDCAQPAPTKQSLTMVLATGVLFARRSISPHGPEWQRPMPAPPPRASSTTTLRRYGTKHYSRLAFWPSSSNTPRRSLSYQLRR